MGTGGGSPGIALIFYRRHSGTLRSRWRRRPREPYGLSKVTLVGDRGWLTHARLRNEVEPAGYTGITPRRKATLRRVLEQQTVQRSLLDEPDWAEVESEDFPGERLIRCRHPL